LSVATKFRYNQSGASSDRIRFSFQLVASVVGYESDVFFV
jgi:hypothetical protein